MWSIGLTPEDPRPLITRILSGLRRAEWARLAEDEKEARRQVWSRAQKARSKESWEESTQRSRETSEFDWLDLN